jgi:NAD(P)-dependent dehydrogenase (short-subunit alcohol dehydrogenase family)
MAQEFDGKLVIITGVGRAGQVGEMLALRFAEAGATVGLIDRDADALNERAAELKKAGHRVIASVTDLTDPDSVAKAAAECTNGGRTPVDGLVAAAGGFAMSGPVAESDFTAWQRQLQISLYTAYFATRAFLPMLRAARGSIVYFASAAVLGGAKTANMSGYAVAKAGVVALMHAVSQEERSNGVRANAIAPTSIRTAANVSAMGGDQAYVDRESVADVVQWLCSNASRDVTGQTIRLGA